MVESYHALQNYGSVKLLSIDGKLIAVHSPTLFYKDTRKFSVVALR